MLHYVFWVQTANMYGCSHILFYNPTIYLSMNRWHAYSLINRKLYEDEICAQFNRP